MTLNICFRNASGDAYENSASTVCGKESQTLGWARKFLVRAVNQLGDSPDLETESEIVARNPYDTPSQPGKPNVQDWGEDWAELSWRAPDDDGGADISGYRVEVRNRDRRAWNVAGTASGSETK